ncbi:MAG: dephospho-CoA kinase [Thermoflexaceae bacterium]|nr:dephospho-CoA kinase [Thermoflexaceae bacterium]
MTKPASPNGNPTCLVIGLTGTIAAGKSTVAALLEECGAIHCDADRLVHRLYDPGTPGFDRVVAEFGEDVVGADGYIDRKALGAKVFGKPAEMAKLTAPWAPSLTSSRARSTAGVPSSPPQPWP